MPRHFRLLDQTLVGLTQPMSIESLSAAHPLWAGDLAAAGPVPVLGDGRGSTDVVLCGPCASTMDVARRLVEAGVLAAFGSVITPEQTAGRGQLRRAWLSRPGNVLATLVCPPALGLWNDLRPLVLGYLFAEALTALGEPVQVKWPNDLLSGGRKVAGILVEERKDCVLAGIGINLGWAPPAEALREGHSVDAGEFVPSDCVLGPARLWRALVNHIETGYTTLLEAFSPAEFLTIFRARMAWQGRRVLVSEGEGVRYEAVVRGISPEGGLLLDRAGREVVLLAGDVIPV